MQKSYTRNYLQIYIWKILAFSLQFISMFIVSPRLTSVPAIYGIYSICISVTIFLSYADIGFLGAAYKYASGFIAQNKKEEEIKVIGFATFVSLIFVGIFAVTFLCFSFFPELLIKNLVDQNERLIASQLLLVLAIFSPTTCFNRMISIIFGIRLEDYFFSAIELFGSITKILSVFFFFSSGTYDIVGYFLFSQIVSFICIIIGIMIAKMRYKYDLKLLLKSVRISKEIYKLMKGLAFNTLYISIMGILYFEIDLLVIGPVAGADAAAFYAIGLTILTIFRSLITIVSSPFPVRFSHFLGLKDENGLKQLYINIIIFTTPLIVIPLLTVVLYIKPFIFTWVGSDYEPSVLLAQFLVIGYVYQFFAQPAYFLLWSTEKTRSLYLLYTMQTIVYWGGIVVTFPFLGLFSFSLFKFIMFTMGAIYFFRIGLRFLKMGFWSFLKRFLFPILIPIMFLMISTFFISPILPMAKDPWNLLFVLIVCGGVGGAAFVIYFVVSKDFRTFGLGFIQEIFPSMARILKFTKGYNRKSE